MALGLKYQGTFKDRSGTVVTVDLYKEGHIGGSTTLPLSGPEPVEREDGRPGRLPLWPIRGSGVTVTILPSAASIADEIYSDATAWQMRVSVGGQEDFRGPVVRQLRTRSLDAIKRDGAQIRAICGLGAFRDKSWLTQVATDSVTRADKTVAGWIIYILDTLGYSFPVNFHSNYFALNMVAGDPLTQEYLNGKAWTFDSDPDRTVYDVLFDILAARGLFVYQDKGEWHVYQARAFAGASFTRYTYASGSTATATGTPTTYTTKITAQAKDRLSGATLDAVEEIASARVTYNHGTVENLVPNGGLTGGDDDAAQPFTGWTKSGTVQVAYQSSGRPSVVGFNGAVPGTGFSDAIDFLNGLDLSFARGDTVFRMAAMDFVPHGSASEDAQLEALAEAGPKLIQDQAIGIESSTASGLNVRMSGIIPLSGPSAADTSHPGFTFRVYVVVKYKVGATTHYLKRTKLGDSDPSWETTKSRLEILVPGNEPWEVVVQTPPVDALGDGEVSVELETAVGDPRNGDPGYTIATKLFWNGIQITPVVEDASSVQSSTNYIVEVLGAAGQEGEPTVVTNGTGPTLLHPGASKTSAGVMVNDWGLGVQVSASGRTLAQRLAEDKVMMQRNSIPVLRATYRISDPTPIVAIDDGDTYLPVYRRRSYKWKRTEVEAVKVQLDGFTQNFVSRSDDAQGNFNATSGEGSAASITQKSDFIGQFSTFNDITQTTANLTGVITSIPVVSLPSEQAVLAEGEFIAVASKNGPVWEFEIASTPIAPITSISVVSQDIGSAIIPSGSGVHPGTGSLVSVQSQTQNALFQSVKAGDFTELTADVSGSASSLPVSATPFDLKDGWEIEITSSHKDHFGKVFTATVNGIQSAPDTAIAIDPATIFAKSGDPIRLKSISMVTEITQNAAEIDLRVRQDGVIASINLSVEGVKIDGDNIEINGSTTFATGFDPSAKADSQRSSTAPVARSDGSSLRSGDVWINTSEGDRPYSYTGAGWAKSTTSIDGGEITTGTINADRINLTFSQINGDFDQIPDGGTYAKVLSANITAGKILLSESTGTIGDIADGGGFAKILSTEVSAGHILIKGSDGLTTVITGGQLQTNAIKATEIDVDNLFAETITLTGSIGNTGWSISASGIIMDAGSINLGGGAFSVTTAGVLTATTGTFGGSLDAVTGTLGALTVTGDLQLSGNNVVRADGSSQFSSSVIGGIDISGRAMTVLGPAGQENLDISAGGGLNLQGSEGVTIGSTGGSMTISAGLGVSITGATINGGTPWTGANHGAASGLDADLLDGQHGSHYLDLGNATGTLALASGGTGATTASGARTNLGLGSFATISSLALGGLSNVEGVGSPSNGDVLTWNSTIGAWTAQAP